MALFSPLLLFSVMWPNPESARSLLYRHQTITTPSSNWWEDLTDVYQSEGYRALDAMVGGLTKYDIVASIRGDGYSALERREHWFFHIVNYNLPPSERVADKNAYVIGYIPGPRKPQHDWFQDFFVAHGRHATATPNWISI
ncbi:hypothetical protein BCR44DRAFT_240936 [Catenaria anguillulae PL171]|uniref:Uncharacterized protein n=1 Tax=Catenaria anguillulae PL171 TaxID=765915 RepID=A0A1Y2HPM3_9FUNG|nr:hypothetical protein BCR44DRAFT_240936 [Catenaria anguillulae PL171]